MPTEFFSGIFREVRAPLAAAVCGAVLALIAATSALACACCTNTAWRYVDIEKLEAAKLAEIAQIAFARDAKLMLGKADDDGIKGVADPAEDYTLSVSQQIVSCFRSRTRKAAAVISRSCCRSRSRFSRSARLKGRPEPEA